MGAMAHIQAKNVCTCLKQGTDGGVVTGSGAKCRHDLYIPKASHALFLFIAVRLRWVAGLMAQLAGGGNVGLSLITWRDEFAKDEASDACFVGGGSVPGCGISFWRDDAVCQRAGGRDKAWRHFTFMAQSGRAGG
jgi:hypothetical protein